jgi:hypothetical protein
LQHGWPVPPHAEQTVVLMRQEDWDAVQVLRSQQVSFTLPQDTPDCVEHEPMLHVPDNPGRSG